MRAEKNNLAGIYERRRQLEKPRRGVE